MENEKKRSLAKRSGRSFEHCRDKAWSFVTILLKQARFPAIFIRACLRAARIFRNQHWEGSEGGVITA